MSISVKTRKRLWGRGGNRCAFSGCRIELVQDVDEDGATSVVGEECHIVGEKEGAARGKSDLAMDQRDEYPNLILMCSMHHKIIDDHEDKFPVAALHELKREHEAWVRSSLAGYDAEQQRADEVYAAIVSEWAERVELDSWDAWCSNLTTNGAPRLPRERFEQLRALSEWLLSRHFPNRDARLEGALTTFRRVLSDMLLFLEEHQNPDDAEWVEIDRPWKRRWVEQDVYNAMSRDYDDTVDTAMALAAELTRAANLIATVVRERLDHAFRKDEGVTLLMWGPYEDLRYYRRRHEYPVGTDSAQAYPSFEAWREKLQEEG